MLGRYIANTSGPWRGAVFFLAMCGGELAVCLNMYFIIKIQIIEIVYKSIL